MTNIIADVRPAPTRNEDPSQPAFQVLCKWSQRRVAYWTGHVESYVQEHPVTGIGAAICIGIFLGWMSKRR